MSSVDLEPLSPELVLVCPELRPLALHREASLLGVDLERRSAAAVPAPHPEPPRPPSMFPLTAAVLAVSLAVGGYVVGREHAAPDAPASAAPAILQPRARALHSEGVVPAATTSAASRVELSGDGRYVTALQRPSCPGVPALPRLVVSDGRFGWSGRLGLATVDVAGTVLAGDRVRATARYRGPGCNRTITFRTTATRAR